MASRLQSEATGNYYKGNPALMRMTQSAPCAANNRDGTGMRKLPTMLWLFVLMAGAPLTSVFAQPAVQSSSEGDPRPQNLTLSAGVNVWDGKFGAVTGTDITTELISARYQLGAVRLTANIPNMRIRSDGTFFAGLGGTPLFVAPNAK